MTTQVVFTRQVQRRDTAANWTAVNPVLLSGEWGLETDTRRLKIGDGVTAWNALAYNGGTPGGPSDPTNLSIINRTAAGLTIASSTGGDVDVPLASETLAGLLAPGIRAKAEGAVQEGDARLSNARDWSAATVDQPTAEAGSSTARFAYTPQRVFQAIAAWWVASAAKAKLDGIASGATANATNEQLRDRSTHTGTQPVGTITGLGTGVPTALAINVGTAGAPVILGGAGGTPSALGLINATGLPLSTGVTGLLPVANGGTGTATPGMVQGANITISGSWPNQTINATANVYSFAATQRVFGRNSAGAGSGEEVSLSQLLDWGSSIQGTILYRGASGWVALAPGTAGQFLQTAGAAANPTWAALSGSGDALTASPLSQFAATTSAQLRGVISDETGTGLLFFQGGDIGTPTAGALTNCTGLPLGTGITGLGTGIAAALAINAGTAGAPVLFNAAAGTPSSLTLTNATGLPFGTGISGKPTTLAGYGITDGFTEAQVRATPLTGYNPAAGTVAETDSILQAFQKVVGNIASRALAGLIGSSGLTMTTNRLAGRFDAGAGAVQEITPAGGLILLNGKLVPGEIVKLRGSNIGDTSVSTGNQKDEIPIDRNFTIIGVWWTCAPTAMATASASDARPYIRTGAGTTSVGTKTNILTTAGNVVSLAPSVHTVNATASISGGSVSGAARDSVGFDYMSHGTGSSGHVLTLILLYPDP